MATGGRFDPASGSPEGSTLTTSYSNGQRSSFAAGSLDRSSSFREGSDSRMTGCGSTISRGDASSYVDLPSISQWLNLDSMSMGDQKSTRLVELKKALNISSIMLMEDGSFGAPVHPKPLSPPMLEDLKRFKSSIIESSTRAKERAKSLAESISKLEKYRNALLSRKRPRNEGLPTERSSGLLSADRSLSGTNSMKMGPQGHQLMGPMDLISPRTDDRTKNMIPNRRMRTSLVESEGCTSTLTRPSGLPEKDRELLRTTSGLSVQSEEKSRVLAPGGDSWEKKMKRKRSVGVTVNRPLEGDHDHKRSMQQRASNESRSRTIDSYGFRSGSANSIVGVNKLDSAAQSSGLNVHPIARSDADSAPLDRRDRLLGPDKEKVIMKGIAKQNVREGNLSGNLTPVAKLKASRAPRTGSSVMFSSVANFARAPGALERWLQPSSLNKTQGGGGASNNRKRPRSAQASSPRSSSPPVAKWVGQRPQKISRVARRTNLVPPVINSEEVQLDTFTSSDAGARLISGEANGSGPLRRISSTSQQFKLKVETVPSPAGFSESEDSGAVDKSKAKGRVSEAEDRAVSSVQKATSFVVPPKKKPLMKDETGDGVRRQGRTGRGSALSRSCLPHSKEKVDIPKHRKLVTDKIESKSGRPPTKRFSDRKASGRPGHVNDSLDLTGEADDDREELVAAVSLAREASIHACSSSFWHQIEPVFAFVMADDLTCLQEQKRLAEELENNLCFQYGVHQNKKDISCCEAFIFSPGHLFEEKQAAQTMEVGQNESAKTGSSVDESHVVDTGEIGADRCLERIIPLSQRLLAALIVEDEVSEISCAGGTEREVYPYPSDDSPRGACSRTGNDSKDMDKTESEIESMGELMYHSLDNFSSAGSIISNGFKNPEKGLPCKEELVLDDCAILNSYNSEHHRADRSELSESTISGISSIDCCYKQMRLDDKILLELRSIGLFPEVGPNLSQGEDDEISRDICNLKERLFQQVKKKKNQFCKLEKAVVQEKELQERGLEHLALNKLVEVAYKKLMACRGNNSSNKSGGSKISKQAAQAFVKRTLARCKNFEDTGASCFREHLFKDDLSGPTANNDTKCIEASKGEHNVKLHLTSQNQAKATAILASGPAVNPVEHCGQHINSLKRDLSGAFQPHVHTSDQSCVKDEVCTGRGKKRELLLDDVVSNAAKGASSLGNGLLGGTKGKRSERDRDHSREGVRNSAPKGGRPTAGTVRGECKTKTKPRQKTAQLSTSVNGLLNRPSEPRDSISMSSETAVNGNTKVKEVIPDDALAASDPLDSEGPIDLTHLPLPGMEDLGVSDDLDQGLDLGSWLNCPDDVMQDHDQHFDGLSIPMDDLSDVKMIP